MINWDRVAELREEVGVDDFAEIIELFLEEVDAIIELLRDGQGLSDLEAHLHFLKGSALNLGFAKFAELCQAGETAAIRGLFMRRPAEKLSVKVLRAVGIGCRQIEPAESSGIRFGELYHGRRFLNSALSGLRPPSATRCGGATQISLRPSEGR